MAKQVGPLFITGTIGNISFYKSGGAYLVRKKGGPTRQQVKNGKNFVRTRENCSEFGHCSKAGKILRQAVNRWSAINDAHLYRRLTQLLTKVKNEDKTSVRGARSVNKALKNESGKALMRNFDFNENAQLQRVLLKPLYINKEGYFCIDELNPRTDLVFAGGATQVLMKVVCLQVNFESGKITEHAYEEVLISKTDKERNLQLKPKDSSALLKAEEGELFYFVAFDFESRADKKKNVLCLVDVNVALSAPAKAKHKGQPLPFKIDKQLKNKKLLSFVYATAVVKEAPA